MKLKTRSAEAVHSGTIAVDAGDVEYLVSLDLAAVDRAVLSTVHHSPAGPWTKQIKRGALRITVSMPEPKGVECHLPTGTPAEAALIDAGYDSLPGAAEDARTSMAHHARRTAEPICAECREPIGRQSYTHTKDGAYFHNRCWSNV